jgi:uncharacterized oxidoreductase
MNLSGQIILITGGGSGIGLEFTKQLVARGNTVIITGRDEAKLKRVQTQLPKVHYLVSDVSKSQDIETLAGQVIKNFPKLNILINNAGIMREVDLNQKAANDQDLIGEVETNFMGPIRMIDAFLPHLKKQSSAAIINVTSGLAFVPLPISPVYCATKSALHSFTRSLRVQLAKSAVQIFEVAPPATQTSMIENSRPEDMKGVTIMPVEKMVAAAIDGILRDQYEIRPGQSNQLKMLNRIAPDFIFKQLSRSAARMQTK